MLKIDRAHVAEMIAHSRDEDPEECCGFLAGTDGAVKKSYRISNIHREPRIRFLMCPQQQLDAQRDWEKHRWDALAIYHSHPRGKARPSFIDVSMAVQGGWLDVYHILVSLEDRANPLVRAFHITADGDIIEREFQVV